LVNALEKLNGSDAMERGLLSVSVAASVVAGGLAAVYFAERIGFATSLAPILESLGLALLLINAPIPLWQFARARKLPGWLTTYSSQWLIVFAVVAGIGRLSVMSGPLPGYIVSATGAIAFVVVLAQWLRITSLKHLLGIVGGSAIFATWAGGVVWGRIYKSPLFFEQLMTTGIVHHDGVTLAALGNMLRTYHAASMGLDGVSPYMAYHWGTPWLFAQLSNITSQSVLLFYQLGYVVTMIPLFFGGIVAFAVQVRGEGFFGMHGEDATRELTVWGIFLAATVGILPIVGTDAIGVWTSNLMISESYAVGIPVALMLLATVMRFWRDRGASVIGGDAAVIDYIFLALILPAGLAILGYLKISLMILGFGAAGYAALRLGVWKKPSLLVIALWAVAVVFVTYKRTSLVAHHEGVVPLDFMKSFVPRNWWPFFFLAQFFWSLVYVCLRVRQEGARTLGDLIALAKQHRILDAEVVAVVAIAGVIPGMVLHIDGGSAFYFSDIQRWLSVGLLLAGASTLLPRVERLNLTRLRTIAILVIALPFAVSTLRNSVYWTSRMLSANVELRRSLYPEAELAQIDPRILSLPRLTDPARLHDGLMRGRNYQPVNGLLSLASLPLSEKRRTAVFVPQSETKYWSILARPNACGFSGFVVPSLTGMAMIDGMPDEQCKLSPYYGLSLFEKRKRAQTEADAAPDAVCARAKPKGFERVIQLHFDDRGVMSTSTHECQ
jgi:hypothetical protein